MRRAALTVSPLICLYRIGGLMWLPEMFDEIWMPTVVLEDLLQARFIGYDVPSPFDLPWVQFEDPELTVPSAWMSLDLSSGEVAAMSLAFENRDCTVLLDDPLARKAARAVGLSYWGILKILLEAKAHGLIVEVMPYVNRLTNAGIFFSEKNRERMMKIAGEMPVTKEESLSEAPPVKKEEVLAEEALREALVKEIPEKPTGKDAQD